MSRQRRADDDDDRGKLLGALMRIAYQTLANRAMSAAHTEGFEDLLSMHGNVVQPLWASPEGMRLTELAASAQVTKQSMGAIVDQLCEKGYVERIDDPSDGRAKLVRLTERGRAAVRAIRAGVRNVEADWSRRVGAARVAQMKSTLAEIVASLEAER